MQVGTGDRKPQSPAEILKSFSKLQKESTKLSNTQLTPNNHKLVKNHVNLSQLLSGNKINNNIKNSKSLFVTLKIPQKNSLFVTLKSEKLKLQKKIYPSQSSHPFFQSINEKFKKNFENNNFNKEDYIINKSINLNPPIIKKNYFKISHSDSFILKTLNLPLKPKLQSINSYIPTTFDFLILYTNFKELNKKIDQISNFIITIDSDPNLANNLLNQRYNNLIDNFKFTKFFNQNYISSLNSNNFQQWCDLYKPLNHLELLQNDHISNDITNWITNAFSNLKKVNQFKRKKNLLSNNKKNSENLNSFIVYSDDDDENDNDNDNDNDNFNNHVPSLIIQGPIGCGKSIMIHTIVKEELNGHVFEFNSSQSRAKREIEFNLKQIGTTSLVKKSTQFSNDNSVILFDDVDLIDESNGDKDFWIGVQNLLTYSYRPVIFITNNLKIIPKNILDESTIYKFEIIKREILLTYLDMIALSRGFNFDSKILKNLSNLDLRKSIMELQMLSYHFDKPNIGLVNVTILNDDKSSKNDLNNLTNLKQLQNKLISIDSTYYFEKINKLNSNYLPLDEKIDTLSKAKIKENFNIDRIACLEFYSSKYFSNGSRSKICRYINGEQYNKKHPNNVFQYLPQNKLATDILPLIHELAKWELSRVTYNYPRKFDMHPLDAFEGFS